MEEIQTVLDTKKHGGFYISDHGKPLGEMKISVSGDRLTVYHTEVAPEAEGKGYAKRLLQEMVTYARNHHLKVIPLCPFVHAQFKEHPEEYADIWERKV